MSNLIIEKFIENLTQFYGRAFAIVSGRDAYSFEKDQHKNMLNYEGVYLLLENVPLNGMMRKYDKATLIPADTVNRMIPTSDPNAVKKGFSLSGSKLRMEFYKQCVKLFQTSPILVKECTFTMPRKTVRIDRKDWAWLSKHDGDFIIVCTIMCGDVKRLVNVIRISARNLHFEATQNSKSVVLDLDGIVLKRVQELGYTVTARYGVVTNGQYNDLITSHVSEEIAEYVYDRNHGRTPNPIPVNTEALKAAQVFDNLLKNRSAEPAKRSEDYRSIITVGKTIKVIIPAPDHDFEVNCVITDYRRINKPEPQKSTHGDV